MTNRDEADDQIGPEAGEQSNDATQAAAADDAASSGHPDPEDLRAALLRLKTRIDDQNERIASLARGREQGMAAVSELRAELALVAAERDRLRKQLTDVEGMQTETLTLDDSAIVAELDAKQAGLPSIDELMETFSGTDNALAPSHGTASIEQDSAGEVEEFQEMISPELIVFGSRRPRRIGDPERYLVLLEGEQQSKCPLDEDLLTIGRSDSADIKIDGDYISRIHARILRIGMDSVIEDAQSKNGTRVNGQLVLRHTLKHGDLIRIGSANFRFVDPVNSGEDEID